MARKALRYFWPKLARFDPRGVFIMRSTLLGTAALFAITATAPLFAQSVAPAGVSASNEPTEIVVTAQKRSERLQDVPLAVTVISGDALTKQGAVSLEGAQYLVPSLNFRKSGTTINQSLYLRGVGTATFSIAGEPSVSAVLDGVVLSRAGEAFTDLVDIERIEVLRGPQGTLSAKTRPPVSSTSFRSAPATSSAASPKLAIISTTAMNIAFAAPSICRSAITSAAASPAFMANMMATSSTMPRA
jgi:outer membrane receptor for monomeric catechols